MNDDAPKERGWTQMHLRPSGKDDMDQNRNENGCSGIFQFVRRTFKVLIGLCLTLIGVIILPLPGPFGTPVIIMGIGLLAAEFGWAQRLKRKVERWTRRSSLKNLDQEGGELP